MSTTKPENTEGQRKHLQTWLVKQLDQTLKNQPYKLTPKTEGWCATVYHITTRNEQFLLKTTLETPDMLWSVNQLQHEANIYKTLNPQTHHTPHLITQLNTPDQQTPEDTALLLTWIAGTPLSRKLKQTHTPPIYDATLNILNKKLFKPTTQNLKLWKPGGGTIEDLLSDHKQRKNQLSKHDNTILTDAAEQNKNGIEANNNTTNTTIIHADLHPGNIIIKNNNTPAGIIDWDKATIGPQEVDITKLWCTTTLTEDNLGADHIYHQYMNTPTFNWTIAATILIELGNPAGYTNWINHYITPTTNETLINQWTYLAKTITEHLK